MQDIGEMTIEVGKVSVARHEDGVGLWVPLYVGKFTLYARYIPMWQGWEVTDSMPEEVLYVDDATVSLKKDSLRYLLALGISGMPK